MSDSRSVVLSIISGSLTALQHFKVRSIIFIYCPCRKKGTNNKTKHHQSSCTRLALDEGIDEIEHSSTVVAA